MFKQNYSHIAWYSVVYTTDIKESCVENRRSEDGEDEGGGGRVEWAKIANKLEGTGPES